MTPKEIAAQYEAKVFDNAGGGEGGGIVLTDTLSRETFGTRPVRPSLSSLNLQIKRNTGEAKEIGLVIEPGA